MIFMYIPVLESKLEESNNEKEVWKIIKKEKGPRTTPPKMSMESLKQHLRKLYDGSETRNIETVEEYRTSGTWN